MTWLFDCSLNHPFNARLVPLFHVELKPGSMFIIDQVMQGNAKFAFFCENYDENLVLFWNGSIDDTIGDSYIQFYSRIYSERLRLRLRLESRLRLELRLLRSLLDIDTTSLLYQAISSQGSKNETPKYENKQTNKQRKNLKTIP